MFIVQAAFWLLTVMYNYFLLQQACLAGVFFAAERLRVVRTNYPNRLFINC